MRTPNQSSRTYHPDANTAVKHLPKQKINKNQQSRLRWSTWQNVLWDAWSEKEIKVDVKPNSSLQGHLRQDTKGKKKQACIEKGTAGGKKCEDACNTSIVGQC